MDRPVDVESWGRGPDCELALFRLGARGFLASWQCGVVGVEGVPTSTRVSILDGRCGFVRRCSIEVNVYEWQLNSLIIVVDSPTGWLRSLDWNQKVNWVYHFDRRCTF